MLDAFLASFPPDDQRQIVRAEHLGANGSCHWFATRARSGLATLWVVSPDGERAAVAQSMSGLARLPRRWEGVPPAIMLQWLVF